jgi:hypothetical protein
MEWGLLRKQNELQPKTDRAHVEAEMLVDLDKLVLVADIDFVHCQFAQGHVLEYESSPFLTKDWTRKIGHSIQEKAEASETHELPPEINHRRSTRGRCK